MKTGNWDAVRPPEIEILKYNEQWMFESFKSTREIMSESKKNFVKLFTIFELQEKFCWRRFSVKLLFVYLLYLDIHCFLSVVLFSISVFPSKIMIFLKILQLCLQAFCLFVYVEFGERSVFYVKHQSVLKPITCLWLKHWKSLFIFPQINNVAKFWKIIWLF